MKRVMILVSWLFLSFVTFSLAHGQGVFITSGPHPFPLPRPRPIPPSPPQMSYKIKELAVAARIQDQIAKVQVSQSFVNTGSLQMEVSFCFPLPYDGAIDQMTFMVDGKEYEAKLLPAQQAREIYEGHVRRNADPALLEWIGSGMFKTSVFPVPPGAERKVTLNFTQLLRKTDRLTDFLYPLSTAKFTSQPVESFRFTANIESKSKLKSIYSPTHLVDIKRPDDNHAVVTIEAKNAVPTNDLRLFFDTANEEVGASLISYRPDANEDGFFLLLASPEVKAADAKLPSKTVVFALDRSGSMSGKKIDQAKEALRFVVNNLREGDLFNIVVYDTSVESFKPELQRYDDSTRKAALGFIESIYAGGSTNISGALTTSLKMIQDANRPSYIVFLTDGLPTTGEKNEMKISQLTKQNNSYRTRIVSFGVGYDVNSRLLDRISRDNYGQSEFVRPDEDLEQHVSRLYQRMSLPVMTDVKLSLEVDQVNAEHISTTNRVYPKQMLDLFAGEQVVVVGRYKSGGKAKVIVSGSVSGQQVKLDFPADLTNNSLDQSFAFVEKLWATRRIGEIIDEIDLNGKNSELINELVSLSTKHGIITPYTSFLADETSKLNELASANSSRLRASEELRRLSVADGKQGLSQRASKKSLQEAQAPMASGLGGFGIDAYSADESAPHQPGAVTYRDAESDRTVVVNSVQSIGNETLYKRGKIWIAESAKAIDLEKDSSQIEIIERFGDAYFKLVAENNSSENAILAHQKTGEELVLKLRGKFYRIR
jgi:Ca-activated chloride channel homolog